MKRLERTLEQRYKEVPHLPPHMRAWLADNAWRIVIVGAVLSIASIFIIIPIMFTAFALTPPVSTLIEAYVPYYNNSLGLAWVALLSTAIVFFVTAVMLSFAANPMKEKRREGWNLTFYAYLLNLVLGIVTLIIVPSLLELFVVVLITLFCGYCLFEIRDDFHRVLHRQTVRK